MIGWPCVQHIRLSGSHSRVALPTPPPSIYILEGPDVVCVPTLQCLYTTYQQLYMYKHVERARMNLLLGGVLSMGPGFGMMSASIRIGPGSVNSPDLSFDVNAKATMALMNRLCVMVRRTQHMIGTTLGGMHNACWLNWRWLRAGWASHESGAIHMYIYIYIYYYIYIYIHIYMEGKLELCMRIHV